MVGVSDNNYALKIARDSVHYYSNDEELFAAHLAALDCFDCEARLQLGINSFQWLMFADAAYRRAISRLACEYDPAVEEYLGELLRDWLRPLATAETWIERVTAGGHELDNLEEFQHCRDQARSIVEAMEDHSPHRVMEPALEALQDQAIIEHTHGETAEFF